MAEAEIANLNWLETLWAQAHNNPTTIISLLALIISFALLIIKIWESFFKDRLKIGSTYHLTGERGVPNEISILNLSQTPIHVAYWKLKWEPKWFAFWLDTIDVSPDETHRFTIEAQECHDINHYFDWGWQSSNGRKLILYIKIIGRKRIFRVKIK